MILSCPQCAARFRIDADKLGVAGRKVRCAKCGHTWHATPDQDEEAATAQDDDGDASEAAASGGEGVEDASPSGGDSGGMDDLPDGPPPFESFEAMRASLEGSRRARRDREPPPQRSRLRPLVAWLVFFCVVGSVVAGAYYARYQVVATLPKAARLYDLAGISVNTLAPGLKIESVTPSRRLKDGTSVLMIQGEIVNRTGTTQPLPALRITLRNGNGAALDQWQTAAESAALPPGGRTGFTARRETPPADAREISVIFDKPGA